MTRETVPTPTPAAADTSAVVARRECRMVAFPGLVFRNGTASIRNGLILTLRRDGVKGQVCMRCEETGCRGTDGGKERSSTRSMSGPGWTRMAMGMATCAASSAGSITWSGSEVAATLLIPRVQCLDLARGNRLTTHQTAPP